MNIKSPLSIVLFLFLAAGTTGSVYAAPPTDACSLLAATQVSAVLGVSVGAGENILPNRFSGECPA